MPTFVKRLVDNELGMTGGHQRGGILVPKVNVYFFPPLGSGPNPEITLRVLFPPIGYTINLRMIYYNQRTRDEYRITPVPEEIIWGAVAGDFFTLRLTPDGDYVGGVVRRDHSLHDAFAERFHGAGIIFQNDSFIDEYDSDLSITTGEDTEVENEATEEGEYESENEFERLAVKGRLNPATNGRVKPSHF